MRFGVPLLLCISACVCDRPPAARLAVEGSPLDFGKVLAGRKLVRSVTVRNIGTAAVGVARVQSLTAGAPFAASLTPVTLQPGEAVEITVTYTAPAEERVDQARFLVAGDAEAEFSVKAESFFGDCQWPRAIDFGGVPVGQTGEQNITVTNTSPEASAWSIGPVAPPFSVEPASLEVPPGGSATVTLRFTPVSAHEFTATTTTTAVGCPPPTIELRGTGVDALLACEPVPLDFGFVTPGVTRSRDLTLKNFGLAPAAVTGLATVVGASPSTEFFAQATSAQVPGARRGSDGRLVPGTAALPLSFRPAQLGIRNAALRSAEGLHCPLVGQGGGPDIDVSPLILEVGNIPYFAQAPTPFSVTRYLSIRNLGTAPITPDPAGNLRLDAMPFQISARNGMSALSQLCVGAFDSATSTCLNALPSGYDPAVGLVAMAGRNELRLPIRVQPNAPNLTLEWDVTVRSNDPDEPAVTAIVRAHSVELPPCSYTLTPVALDFGLVTEPRELSFEIRNNGANMNESCLITTIDLAPGSSGVFQLPGGPIHQVELGPGQSRRVTVRAAPLASVGPQTVTGSVVFGISDPSAAVRAVPLGARLGEGCLVISPPAADFGTVRTTCRSPERTFTAFNRCSSAVTVALSAPSAGSGYVVGASPANTIAPLSSTTFSLRFQPARTGLDLATFQLRAIEQGDTIDYVVPLTGAGDLAGLNTESFTGEQRAKADVLFAVANTSSMADEQAAFETQLGPQLQSLAQHASAAGYSLHFGVITPDLGATTPGQLIGTPAVLTGAGPQLVQRLRAGTTGSPSQGVADAVVRAVTYPLALAGNAGFLRDDAALTVIAFTDAADQSPLPASYYAARLRDLKRGRPDLVSYNVSGPSWPASGSCPVDDAWPAASKLRALTLALGGEHAEICTANPGTFFTQAMGRAFGGRSRFGLTGEPDVAAGPVLLKMNGMIVDQVDSSGAPVWRYDGAANSVSFEPLFVPAPGEALTVTYTATCH